MHTKEPPKISSFPIYKLPPVYETRLPNGLTVLLVNDNRFPTVTARLGFPAGSKFDPFALRGLSEMTAALLTEGTAERSARRIAEEIAAAGGALHADSSADSLILAGYVLAGNLPRLLDLTADVTRNAVFPEDEVALRKENRKQELAAQRSEASFLADEKFFEVIFSPHPYAYQDPAPETIDRMDRATLARFRDRHLAPNGAVLVLLGALPDRNEVLEMVASRFGDWPRGEEPAPPQPVFKTPARSVNLIDREDSVQADIRIGRLGVTRQDPHYFPLFLANTILGGGASSRMFANIREKMGYAYDAHSSAIPLKDSGSVALVTQVRNEVLEPALDALLAEMARIAATDVSPEELETAKNYLSGVFVIRIETQAGLAGQLAAVKLLGLPIDYLEHYTERVRAVDASAVRAAAGTYLNPERASIVVVGDGASVEPALRKFGTLEVAKAES